MRLGRKFFNRDAEIVARELLGKFLVRKFSDGTNKKGIVIETEAYLGVEDKAAHSFGGRRTKRNEVMYGKAGVAYVYFTYGIHWLLNIITGDVGNPQGVLVRGIREVGETGEECKMIIGPARVTKYLEIDGAFNGEDVVESNRLWVEEDKDKDIDKEIITTPRIGIDYAGDWKDKPLRFGLKV